MWIWKGLMEAFRRRWNYLGEVGKALQVGGIAHAKTWKHVEC
jgi:hypothetical protein